jgi:hypothetical protein
VVESVTALAPIQKLNSNWRSLTISILQYQCQQSVYMLCWAPANSNFCLVNSLYTNTHRTMKLCLGRNNLSMQLIVLDLNRALKCQKQNTIWTT